MGLCLKTTAGLLLLVQAFHLASLQASTDSPRRTISRHWHRDHPPNTAGNQGAAVTEEETENDQGPDNIEMSSGIASGFMMVENEEEENLVGHDTGANDTSDVPTTVPPTAPTNVTTKPAALPDTTVSPTNATTKPTNSSQTKGEEEIHNSMTTTLSAQTTTTTSSDHSNRTDLQTTASAPKSNATQESTKTHNKDTGLTNTTGSTNTTTATTTTTQKKNETSTTSSTATVFPSTTTKTSPVTTTTAAPITPEKANKTDKDAASGSSSERGMATDTQKSKRHGAWGAVLGTAVAVAFVALVAYVILKKKQEKGFSHSKLVEEYPSDPVLRLDNSPPLDLNFGGSAYFNPGLQGDNIQMTNFPGRH